MKNIYVVGGGNDVAKWCRHNIVNSFEKADVIVFTGGEDVSPFLYNKKRHPTTSNNPTRDMFEERFFKKAVEQGKGMLGICRGSQLLCALSGGELVQDQSHPYLHDVSTNDGRTIQVTSTHHQRQYIKNMPKTDYKLIAWAEHLSPKSFGETDEDDLSEDQEAEIVYYPKTRALAIQSHPEYVFPPRHDWERVFTDYCKEIFDKYFG